MRLQSLNRAQRVRKQALDGTSTPVDGEGEGDADAEAEVEGDREVDADHETENHHDDDHPHDQEMHDSASNDIDNDAIPRKRFRPYSDDSSTENSMGESSLPEHIPETPVRVGEMELVFRPHPQEAEPDAVNTLRFIKTTSNATGRYKLDLLMVSLRLILVLKMNIAYSGKGYTTVNLSSKIENRLTELHLIKNLKGDNNNNNINNKEYF